MSFSPLPLPAGGVLQGMGAAGCTDQQPQELVVGVALDGDRQEQHGDDGGGDGVEVGVERLGLSRGDREDHGVMMAVCAADVRQAGSGAPW